jgi:hypothetical protein
MGFGDNEPPAIRADPFPATLRGPGGFNLLILTFVTWDVIKLSVVAEGEAARRIQFDAGKKSIDFSFQPVRSKAMYTFTAQGCDRALDGSTNFCSPVSRPLTAQAAENTNSLKQFLLVSGVVDTNISLRRIVNADGSTISLRTLMGLSF